jgi:hypothetical protein
MTLTQRTPLQAMAMSAGIILAGMVAVAVVLGLYACVIALFMVTPVRAEVNVQYSQVGFWPEGHSPSRVIEISPDSSTGESQ